MQEQMTKGVILYLAFLLLGLCLAGGCADSDTGEAEMIAQLTGQASAAEFPSGGEAVPVTLASSLPADEEILVNVAFAGAKYNDDPESDLSHLAFDLSATCGQRSVRDSVSISSTEDKASASVDTGACKVEVHPLICGASQTGSDEYTIRGGYRVTVKDQAEHVMADFKVNERGAMTLGKKPASGYSPKLVFCGDGGGHARYYVYSAECLKGHKRDAVLGVEFKAEGDTQYDVSSPEKTVFSYVFPDGELKVYPAAALEWLEDDVLRDVRAVSGGAGGGGCAPGGGGGGG
jgi:hypothetical protein